MQCNIAISEAEPSALELCRALAISTKSILQYERAKYLSYAEREQYRHVVSIGEGSANLFPDEITARRW